MSEKVTLDIDKLCRLTGGKFNVIFKETLPSTNSFLSELATGGAPEYTLVTADSQTSGRGRLGRSFSSPAGTGVYASLLLKPRMNAEDSLIITAAAACAAARAVENVCGRPALIKWVNDIYINDKKVCGILAETKFSGESADFTVLGIGINVNAPKDGFDDDVKDIAGAMFDDGRAGDFRAETLAEFLNIFDEYYKSGLFDCVPEYEKMQYLTGKKIYVIRGDERIPAKATGVDGSCALIVEYENGVRDRLTYGDVSVKPAL
ncbi:MAG: biotin--[acetyl-CoA-carboxylase] ligase [Clostridiales bacterium]|nr:biotin--[acetyl-CoA-carboxylase] ligase [Clostridiales bacterium]